jgi:hypothetical protein
MEQQEQLEPLTPEQIEAEAAYAEEIYQRDSNLTAEEIREILERIKLHFDEKSRRSAATTQSSPLPSHQPRLRSEPLPTIKGWPGSFNFQTRPGASLTGKYPTTKVGKANINRVLPV